jgi:hypothetical protein
MGGPRFIYPPQAASGVFCTSIVSQRMGCAMLGYQRRRSLQQALEQPCRRGVQA